MSKPRLLTKCVANTYSGPHERIAEFSFPGTDGPAGGLLALRMREGARPLVQLYRVEGCDVSVSQDDKPQRTPPAVMRALQHVREHFPNTRQVFYGLDARWLFMDAEGRPLDFMDSPVDVAILEDAQTEVDNTCGFPAAFALPDQN